MLKTNFFVIMSRRLVTRVFLNVNLPNNETTSHCVFRYMICIKNGLQFVKNCVAKIQKFSTWDELLARFAS